jgi:hypothetical protein
VNAGVRSIAAAALALASAAGCDERRRPSAAPPSTTPAAAPTVPTGPGPAKPLPSAATDDVGDGGPTTVIAAGATGAWVALCVGGAPRLVVGSGPGAPIDRLIAHGPDDVVFVRDGGLFHVDAAARTERRLGPAAAAALDPKTRRVAVAWPGEIAVLDPGVAPRRVVHGERAPAALTLRDGRWAQLWPGQLGALLDEKCAPHDGLGLGAPPSTLDLDPTATAEAPRLGPEVGITATGEVTLDGEVVVPASCAAEVVAALASPPRVLVRCGKGDNQVAGPGGFTRAVGGHTRQNAFAEPSILDPLRLGQRVVCIYGACVDLIGGASFSTYSNPPLWHDDRVVVRLAPDGLWLDYLSADPATPPRHQELALPRIAAAVTVDTVTGARRTGTRPPAPEVIGAAGRWLLYGRYLIDLEAGVLAATLAVDALAVDARGRVLAAAPTGSGALRWQAPSGR